MLALLPLALMGQFFPTKTMASEPQLPALFNSMLANLEREMRVPPRPANPCAEVRRKP